jgi:hypothetical protein
MIQDSLTTKDKEENWTYTCVRRNWLHHDTLLGLGIWLYSSTKNWSLQRLTISLRSIDSTIPAIFSKINVLHHLFISSFIHSFGGIYVQRNQRPTCGCWLSTSTIWIQEIKFQLPGLATSPSNYWAMSTSLKDKQSWMPSMEPTALFPARMPL